MVAMSALLDVTLFLFLANSAPGQGLQTCLRFGTHASSQSRNDALLQGDWKVSSFYPSVHSFDGFSVRLLPTCND